MVERWHQLRQVHQRRSSGNSLRSSASERLAKKYRKQLMNRFEEQEAPGSRLFFTEIIASISNIKFAKGGRHILSRDYMTLKLWDINMDSGPVATYQVHEYLRPKLYDLYENDSIFDKFECCLSGDGSRVATGSYSNLFHVFGCAPGSTDATTLEASKHPLRVAFSEGRFGALQSHPDLSAVASLSLSDEVLKVQELIPTGIHSISLQSCSTWHGTLQKTQSLVLLQIVCTCIMHKKKPILQHGEH